MLPTKSSKAEINGQTYNARRAYRPMSDAVKTKTSPLYEKSCFDEAASMWEQRESNPRPSACKADALNQLSYAPVKQDCKCTNIFLFSKKYSNFLSQSDHIFTHGGRCIAMSDDNHGPSVSNSHKSLEKSFLGLRIKSGCRFIKQEHSPFA